MLGWALWLIYGYAGRIQDLLIKRITSRYINFISFGIKSRPINYIRKPNRLFSYLLHYQHPKFKTNTFLILFNKECLILVNVQSVFWTKILFFVYIFCWFYYIFLLILFFFFRLKNFNRKSNKQTSLETYIYFKLVVKKIIKNLTISGCK